jgi:hypothetical protein
LLIQEPDLVEKTNNASVENDNHKHSMDINREGADENEGIDVVSIHLPLSSFNYATYSNFKYIVFAYTSKEQTEPHW